MVGPKGLIVSAAASGSGKTIVTLGCLRALRRAGIAAAGAKVGPDYVDPAFHAAASGRPGFGLDTWAMRSQTLDGLLSAYASDGSLVVCEGVMGLFDGAKGGAGATADLAARTGWPVILVVDASGQAASAAALVQGFARHRADVTVAAVVFNRVGGPGHEAILRDAMERHVPGVRVLGCIARDERLTLPSRHLGLVQAGEHANLESFLEAAADAIAGALDLEGLRALARPARLTGADGHRAVPCPVAPLGQRIAVASDSAFAFCYESVLRGWREAGAEVVPFSPLAGDGPDASAGAVYLPGGYPELHAGRIAESGFLSRLREAAGKGATVYGECGGYMVMGRGLEDGDGRRFAMAGLLPLETSFAKRRLHIGYREVETGGASPLGPAGTRFRGHEFHFATLASPETGPYLFTGRDAEGAKLGGLGAVSGRIAGSFVHLIDRA
ncbi:MAG: cobyrinate a,c-diamide synthase [Alphaproteobacteria bacterium]